MLCFLVLLLKLRQEDGTVLNVFLWLIVRAKRGYMQAELRGMEDKRAIGLFHLPFPREAEPFPFQFRHAENESCLSLDNI